MEVVVVCALLVLSWFAWQLVKAKRFTRFKLFLTEQISPQVEQGILEQLTEQQSELYPNNEIHQQATLYFWTQYRVRILQWALMNELLTEQQLKKDKQWRNCQHLFYIEKPYLVTQYQKLEEREVDNVKR